MVKLVKFTKNVLEFKVNLPYPNSNLELANRLIILGECIAAVRTTATGLNSSQVLSYALNGIKSKRSSPSFSLGLHRGPTRIT